MYRRGPPISTPAGVQCQKCLKRGHYSYECKASTQDRPYVPRPSRTQQFLNPKLAPKLTSEAPGNLRKEKGLADRELAKREAERARKRELEGKDSDGGDAKRRRSASYNSASSTGRTPSPPLAGLPSAPLPNVISPEVRVNRSPARHASRHGRESYDSTSDLERRYSPSPRRQARAHTPLERSQRRSKPPARHASPVHSHYDSKNEAPNQRSPPYSRRRRYSSSPSRSPPPPPRDGQRYRSRSSDRPRRRGRSPARYAGTWLGRDPAHARGGRGRDEAPSRREQAERSLSPFSRRLALTQAMNMSR
ncbi:zinc knuckle-domain-containing protein [Durotheca rogersii]|uniref:zinc knuckle-domain-containing protein n=1 Tax=Durotheca rogersii TaxID=419775 RepID=UPI00222090AA|nr:zinc knuckle-domain-containing protein [Durotheca rogersii]KAI5857343.1 zinc knuckle-domain-containing protein [Durotheca rogersii]